jgi:Leucine-rich repeat (LRR) protein
MVKLHAPNNLDKIHFMGGDSVADARRVGPKSATESPPTGATVLSGFTTQDISGCLAFRPPGGGNLRAAAMRVGRKRATSSGGFDMIGKRLSGFVAIGILTMASGRTGLAEIVFKGDTATIEFPSDDEDMAALDNHPEVKHISLGGNGPTSGPGVPNPPFAITDAGFAHIANCKKLERLVLISGHRLNTTDAGTAHLSELTNLEELWLDQMRNLSDGTMQAVSQLKKLRVLRFYGSPISDAGVAQIGGLTELDTLLLGITVVGDAGMETIGTLTKLKTLDLQYTRVTDAGMAHLKPLRLTWICLKSTAVTGTGIAALAGMTEMDCLFLPDTEIDDKALDHLVGMKKLTSLDLSKTLVTDAGLAKLAGLEQISTLRLNDLPITDAAIPPLTAMRGLKDIEMNRTQVTKAGFRRLADAGIQRANVSQ